MRRIGLVLLGVLVAVAAWLFYRLNDHPSLAPYERYALHRTEPSPPGRAVTVTFLGVSTLLISDGETALMTDGFFTRPPFLRTLVGRIAPDPETIAAVLRRLGADRLAAVIVVHSHYDHAMDAPEVARRTQALVIGSESTANVARGWGLTNDRIRVPVPGEPMRFGRFTVTLVTSQHFPHGMAMGEITAPLVPPARATAYREGGSYSVLIRHDAGTLLVQGSAGWVDGALSGQRADVVLLGIGGLGTKDEAYMDAYVREVVDAVGARLVVPVHYDDFTLPIDRSFRPMPRLLDDVDAAMAFLEHRIPSVPGRRLAMLPAWEPVALLPVP
jgi:L-ascorbate metabolism protein UlaG (beta-lactamase superfamily)